MSSNRIEGERVFCYQCENQWDRAHGGLQCPRCESEFVEILAPGTDAPVNDPPSVPPSPPPRPEPQQARSPLQDHQPWASVPDPEEDDVTTFEFNTRNGGRGTFSFSTRTYTSFGNGQHVNDPAAEATARNFEEMFSNIVGAQTRPMGGPQMYGGMFNFPPQRAPPFGAFDRQHSPPQPQAHPQPFGLPQEYDFIDPPSAHANALDSLFSMLFQTMGHDPNRPRGPGIPGMASNPLDLLSAILNPANARSGDAVFSQEAFDRVMSQLMEQNNHNGAPPASEDAIKRLPKKKMDAKMVGEDGKAECSICMDGVELGTEVTVLPCNHWFHYDCIESWLKEHDTCPHCRKAISSDNQPTNSQASSSTPGGRRRRSSRRSSSVASPIGAYEENNRQHPGSLPDSPSGLRDARQRFYGGTRRTSDYDSTQSERQHSTRSEGGSRDSRDGDGDGGAAPAGVGGWIRSHMPF